MFSFVLVFLKFLLFGRKPFKWTEENPKCQISRYLIEVENNEKPEETEILVEKEGKTFLDKFAKIH